MAKTKMEEMRGKARRILGPDCTSEEIERHAKHLFARHLSGGATIGSVNGKPVIDREPQAAPSLPDRKPKASSATKDGLANGYDLNDRQPGPYN